MILAIQGHETRGKEVIQLLEMLDGVNYFKFNGISNDSFYYIRKDNNKIHLCSCTSVENVSVENVIFYTLEEFEKLYPYKVGDKVSVYDYESKVRIDEMKWDGFEIQYAVFTDETEWYSAEELNELNEPYKEETNMKTDCKNCGLHYGSVRCFDMDYCPNNKPKSYAVGLKDGEVIECGVNMEDNKVTDSRIDFSLTEKIELDLGDTHEVVVENGKTYVVKKKPTYPKYYTECEASGLSLNPVNVALAQGVCMGAFAKLIVLRNAYWEIAGKQLGLDKPWKPKHEYDEEIFFIYCDRVNGINKGQGFPTDNFCLSFPTAEIRDTFYENFNEEIEMCKELL